MNRNAALILAACLVLLLTGAALLYNSLSGRIEPDTTLGGISVAVESGDGEVSSEPSSAASTDTVSPSSEEDDRVEAPDFTVLDMDGNEVRLSDLRGKPVVLNFWASWCPPCKGEMPDFNKVYLEMGEDVHFMMVDLVDGDRETVEDGKAHIAENGYSFPVYFDTTQEAAYLYGIRSIPTTLFIDGDGYVVTGAQGAISEELLRRGIDLIAGEPE